MELWREGERERESCRGKKTLSVHQAGGIAVKAPAFVCLFLSRALSVGKWPLWDQTQVKVEREWDRDRRGQSERKEEREGVREEEQERKRGEGGG